MYQDRKGMMQGVNMYCPACQFVAAMAMNECNTISLGKPAAASATAIGTGLATNTTVGAKQYLATAWVSDAPYGRPIVATPSGSVTATVDVFGEDYLGQPMIERFAWSAVATAVNGKKPFYRVLGYTVQVAGGAVTLGIGTQANNLGLPFKGSIEWMKEAGVLLDPATAFAKWVAPDLTDPATAITGDTRGQYINTATFDGVKEFIVGMRCDNSLNANNNGGLHGIRQFGG